VAEHVLGVHLRVAAAGPRDSEQRQAQWTFAKGGDVGARRDRRGMPEGSEKGCVGVDYLYITAHPRLSRGVAWVCVVVNYGQ
jgi:hypothetical protein